MPLARRIMYTTSLPRHKSRIYKFLIDLRQQPQAPASCVAFNSNLYTYSYDVEINTARQSFMSCIYIKQAVQRVAETREFVPKRVLALQTRLNYKTRNGITNYCRI